jgi:hypothetical protein
MWLRLLVALALIALSSCDSDGGRNDSATRTTTTREQRDSILGQSRLPGAKAVEKALESSKTAQERAAAIDSLQQ